MAHRVQKIGDSSNDIGNDVKNQAVFDVAEFNFFVTLGKKSNFASNMATDVTMKLNSVTPKTPDLANLK